MKLSTYSWKEAKGLNCSDLVFLLYLLLIKLILIDVNMSEAYGLYKGEDEFFYLEYRETDFAG